ncbi:hypothetical protein [Rhodococcus sp. SGAir0479]|uniref:hypothetical protein n=1 Tax=Rhodococcus sp. SGAir0479 TaxID=2567884 RepID=UPI0010CD3945|nr:hypothetical protein [Rhodococcus sp. SGAir0479]QCQ93569.1 hypothetical protein E7742_21715 [Rhodococcus sp. SGAir0479]
MLEPNGPLPPEIYRRRRVAAVVAIVVVLGLIVWIVSSLTGGDSSDSSAAAETSALTETSEAAPSSSEEKPSESAAASSTSTSASATSTSGAASAQCSDQSLAIKATPDQPQYKIGDEPSFTVAITNIGTAKCERNLGSGLQQALVYTLDGNKRLWSNVDCYPDAEPAVQVLEPGGQARFTVKWSGKTSDPGCTTTRNQVAPGAYTLVAQLGELRSAPEPFNFS